MDLNAPQAVSGALIDGDEQILGQKLTESLTDPITNEANLLTLLTLKQFADMKEEGLNAEQKAVKALASEETRYLLQAMNWLSYSDKGPNKLTGDGAAEKLQLAKHFQRHHGRDMKGAVELAKNSKKGP